LISFRALYLKGAMFEVWVAEQENGAKYLNM
jgi:hypothetical protein